MSLPWPNWTTAEWEERLMSDAQRQKDFDESQHPRDEQGRFDDILGTSDLLSVAGRNAPGEVGGARDALRATLHVAEDRIRYDHNESAIIIGADGIERETLTSGEPNRVELKESVNLENTVLTHNHPGGHSLSLDDVTMASVRNLAEVRAVVSDGTYSMRRLTETWPKDFTESVARAAQAVKMDFMGRITRGEMTVAQASSSHYSTVWSRVVSEANNRAGRNVVLYTFEPKV